MKARTPPSAKLSKKQIYLIEKMAHELAEHVDRVVIDELKMSFDKEG